LDLDVRMTTAKGRRIWTRVQGSAKMTGGNPVELHGTLQDISDGKLALELPARPKDLLRLAALARSAGDAITVYDINGLTIAWNAQAIRLYGWNEAEALRTNVSDRIPPDRRDLARVIPGQASEAEVLAARTTQRLTRDGTVLDVFITPTGLRDFDGKLIAVATCERLVTD
jgi:two-component system CheB/CheR fusion protein